MTSSQLRTRCAFWQKILRLQDWQIDVRFAHAREMAEESRIGETLMNATSKAAIIKVLFPAELSAGDAVLHPIDEIIIHELLHLHFEQVAEDKDINRLAMEQAIEATACGIAAVVTQFKTNQPKQSVRKRGK